MERTYTEVEISAGPVTIVGKLVIPEGEFRRNRLSDFLNREELSFLPLHDVTVMAKRDRQVVDTKPFLLLNKQRIDWVLPRVEPEHK